MAKGCWESERVHSFFRSARVGTERGGPTKKEKGNDRVGIASQWGLGVSYCPVLLLQQPHFLPILYPGAQLRPRSEFSLSPSTSVHVEYC